MKLIDFKSLNPQQWKRIWIYFKCNQKHIVTLWPKTLAAFRNSIQCGWLLFKETTSTRNLTYICSNKYQIPKTNIRQKGGRIVVLKFWGGLCLKGMENLKRKLKSSSCFRTFHKIEFGIFCDKNEGHRPYLGLYTAFFVP